MNSTAKPYAALFISQDTRKRLDRIVEAESKRVGYPLTIKAVVEVAINAMADGLKVK